MNAQGAVEVNEDHVAWVRRLLVGCAVLAGTFWAAHRWIDLWLERTGGTFGSMPRGWLVPLHARPELAIGPWLLPAAVILGVWLVFAPPLFASTARPAALVLLAAFAFFPAIGLGVSMIDGYRNGQPAFAHPYTRGHLEYFGDVPKVEGNPRQFLTRWSRYRFFRQLSLHSRTHPPGGVLFLWAASSIVGYGPVEAALATVMFTAFTIFPVYWLARDYGGEALARCALGLFLVTPSIVLFSTTSMDGPFAVFPILSIFLVQRAWERPRWIGWALLLGLALALSFFMSYASAFLGVFFLVEMLLAFRQRQEWRRRLRVYATATAVFVAFYAGLWWWAGFDIVEALTMSIAHDHSMMGSGHENLGRYSSLSLANVLVFLVGVGLPVAVLWLREVAHETWRAWSGLAFDRMVLAYAIALLVMAFSTLFTLEVERIWMFTMPLVLLPVARHVGTRLRTHGTAPFYAVVVLLALQLVLVEATTRTEW